MHIADLSEETYIKHDDGHRYRSVGWLGSAVTHRGETDPALIATLKFLWNVHQLPDRCLGVHTCEICHVENNRGEFFVEDGDVRYVLPNMVLHYIEAHQYALPDVVAAAIRRTAMFSEQDWKEHIEAKKAREGAQDALAIVRREGQAQGRKEGLRLGMEAGRRAGLAEGRLDGKRDALCRLLARAGLALTDAEIGRIHACDDMAILDRWLDNVFGAKSAADVLS